MADVPGCWTWPSSAMRSHEVWQIPPETSTSIYQTTRHQTPKYFNLTATAARSSNPTTLFFSHHFSQINLLYGHLLPHSELKFTSHGTSPTQMILCTIVYTATFTYLKYCLLLLCISESINRVSHWTAYQKFLFKCTIIIKLTNEILSFVAGKCLSRYHDVTWYFVAKVTRQLLYSLFIYR